jgi:hypothetical protein
VAELKLIELATCASVGDGAGVETTANELEVKSKTNVPEYKNFFSLRIKFIVNTYV